MRACPPRTRGQWSAQSIARLHQDRVVARGADAVLGRQVEERHRNIKERLRQMEAQLEEKNKELLWVRVLMGRPRLGQRCGLGGGRRSRLCHRVCVCSPVC